MTTSSAFQPLKSITVPDAGTISAPGLTVVAGPNSSGKSQLLRDIESQVLGRPRKLVVCERVELELGGPLQDLLTTLCEMGALRFVEDKYVTTAPHLGFGQGGWETDLRHLMLWHNDASSKQFLNHIGQLLITSLFLERRLTICNEVKAFDNQKMRPSNELQAIHLNKSAKQELSDEIAKAFKKAIWMDNTRGGVLCLRVRDGVGLPSADERLEPEEMEKYRTIEFEGDGLKSYVGICLTLLVGRRPILLIDEPEMCLHPPQAYALGRFIGAHATSSGAAVYVATHSSHILRGIIETSKDLRVLRLTHVQDQFRGELMPYELLKKCTERPSTKSESILDGIFAEAVTIVESEGDRIVYSAARDNVADEFAHDVHFVSVGGLGGIAPTCQLYKSLRIPQTVIADLDLILKPEHLDAILQAIAPQVAADLVNEARSITEELKKLGPPTKESDVKGALAALARVSLDWNTDEFQDLRRQLLDLADELSPTVRLKRGGIDGLKEAPYLQSRIRDFITKCVRIGLFLVPVGELEYWEEDVLCGPESPSRRRKAEWANFAANEIRNVGRRTHGIHEFISKMCAFQRSEAERVMAYRTRV